jgi:hypothetical protein
VEGDPGDGLCRVKFTIEEKVADGGPAGEAGKADGDTIFRKDPEFLGDGNRSAITEGHEGKPDGRTGIRMEHEMP